MTPAIARVMALPPGLPALRDEAAAEGFKMLHVLEEDWADGSVRFNGPGEALFAATEADALLAIGGLTHDPYAHAGTARVRRLYVAASHRRRGLGRTLLRTITDHAAAHGFRTVRVRAPGPAACFYEACAFRPITDSGSATHALSF